MFTDDDREVTPGSDEVGMVAAGGNVPLGYFKDPEKSARTFRVIDGVRYSFPGDFAKVAADGSLILLGRGSQVINTGGEKIFPEEVEEAVKRVPGIQDCLVVGVDDEKFGQAVTAVASRIDGADVDADTVIAAVKQRTGRLQGTEVDRVRADRCRVPRTARPTTAPPSNSPPTPSDAASATAAPVEELLAEEVDHALDAGVVALLGQHGVVALLAARAVRSAMNASPSRSRSDDEPIADEPVAREAEPEHLAALWRPAPPPRQRRRATG